MCAPGSCLIFAILVRSVLLQTGFPAISVAPQIVHFSEDTRRLDENEDEKRSIGEHRVSVPKCRQLDPI